MQTWVFAEETDGAPGSLALEMLTKARSFDGDLAAIYIGAGSDEAFATLGAHGAARVFHVVPDVKSESSWLCSPRAPVRLSDGQRSAWATPISAICACSSSSDCRTSGRRRSSSEGRPVGGVSGSF